MFRWIIASSLNLRFLVLAAAAALVAFGSVQLRKMPVDVFPEFAPPVVQVQTEALGPVRRRSAGPDLAESGRTAERRAVAQIDPLRIGSRLVVDPDDVRARHRHHARAPDDPGAPDAGVHAAQRGAAAGHPATDVGDEPLHDGRPVIQHGRTDRTVAARALDRQAAAARRAGCGQRRDLGPAAAPDARADRPEPTCTTRR